MPKSTIRSVSRKSILNTGDDKALLQRPGSMTARKARLKTKLENELFEAFIHIRNRNDGRRFLRDLCTPAEISAMSERWWIARLLNEGRNYRDIRENTGVSLATITRVARFLKEEKFKGYRLIIDRVQNGPADTPTDRFTNVTVGNTAPSRKSPEDQPQADC